LRREDESSLSVDVVVVVVVVVNGDVNERRIDVRASGLESPCATVADARTTAHATQRVEASKRTSRPTPRNHRAVSEAMKSC
jgi:hypothetical protein